MKREGGKTRLSRDEPSGGMPDLWVKTIAQLKCIDTNACGMDNKQEELEIIVQKESCDIVTLTETWRAEGRLTGKWNSRKGPGGAGCKPSCPGGKKDLASCTVSRMVCPARPQQ